MSSFSIIDDNTSAKYKVGFVSIFALSESKWDNSLKSKAFNISSSNLTVLFTGYFSGFTTNLSDPNLNVKIRFNLNGDTTNYIYETINFNIPPQPPPLPPSHWIFPINFIKTFITPGLYDVYVYTDTNSNFSSGFSIYDVPQNINMDTFYLNATFCDIDKEGIFF